MPTLRLIRSTHGPAELDTAVSNALLLQVALGESSPTLRIHIPQRVVAFGSQDRTRPGYHAAIQAVRDEGFQAIERLAGGKAAVFHEGTIAFAWATPHTDSKAGIEKRFTALTDIFIEALGRLGLTGTVGESPGEYCPGRFSVHSAGRKVMGVGQRLVAGAAHVGGVIVVHSPDLVNRPLIPAYAHLGYDWSPDATGSLAGEGSMTVEAVVDALTASFEHHGHDLIETALDPATLARAAQLAPSHLAPIA